MSWSPTTLTPRTRRLLGTTAASYLARLGSAAVLLITVPMAHRLLEPDRFGLWMMLGSLLGFLTFVDFGIGNGLMNRVSSALHRGRVGEVAKTMVAGYFCTLIFGLLLCCAWLTWWLVAPEPLRFAGHFAPAREAEAAWSFSTLILLVALGLPIQLTQKLQLAHQDGYWVGLSQLGATLLTLIALPTALWLGLSLPLLLVCTLGMQLFATGISALVWLFRRNQFPLLRAARLDSSMVFALLRTGLLFFVLQLSAAFAFQSDSFVITQLLGRAAYGDYAAIQRIFLSLSALVSAAMLGLWPAFSDALAQGDLPWARRTFARSLLTGFLLMGMVCLLITWGMPWIAHHWLGARTSPPMALPVLLSIWAVLETLGQITGTVLNGAGIVRAQALVGVLMAGGAFFGKWLLVAQFGDWGAVLATIIAYVGISVPVQWWLLRGVFGHKQAILQPATQP